MSSLEFLLWLSFSVSVLRSIFIHHNLFLSSMQNHAYNLLSFFVTCLSLSSNILSIFVPLGFDSYSLCSVPKYVLRSVPTYKNIREYCQLRTIEHYSDFNVDGFHLNYPILKRLTGLSTKENSQTRSVNLPVYLLYPFFELTQTVTDHILIAIWLLRRKAP